MRRCIINVGVGAWYPEGQKRLGESLDAFGEQAERLFYSEWPKRSHQEVPYGFKPDAFLDARDQGFRQALWLDASCWLVRPLDEAWEQITRDGYLLGQEGWTVGQWCNDSALSILNRSREEVNSMTLIEGKMIGLDFTDLRANEFLDTWRDYSEIGVFNGSWDNHRHDITAGGVIAHDMGLKLTPHLIQYAHEGYVHPEVYVQAQGM